MTQLKFRSVVVDTLNELQNNKYLDLLEKQGNANFDQWRDYAVELMQFFNFVKKKIPNCTLINILGYEGSGKSCGVYYLDNKETMYLNCDNKGLPYFGWNNKYKNGINYSIVSDYDLLEKSIKFASDNRKGHLIIFCLCHIATDKRGDGSERERMKVLGKAATKMNVDGITNHVYYTHIEKSAPEPDDPNNNKKYFLRTHNSGNDTCRTPLGYWKENKIQNNYQLIVDRTLEAVGEKN